MSTIGMTSWANDQTANPAPMSFVPNGLLPFKDNMTLYQRLINIVLTAYDRYLTYFHHYPGQVCSSIHQYSLLFSTLLLFSVEIGEKKLSKCVVKVTFHILRCSIGTHNYYAWLLRMVATRGVLRVTSTRDLLRRNSYARCTEAHDRLENV